MLTDKVDASVGPMIPSLTCASEADELNFN
jgi:hypothetical protein